MTSPSLPHWICPELAWIDGRMHADKAIALGGDGLIKAVVTRAEVPDGQVVEDLPGAALLPGFVNAHSHAFQRVFRGQTEFLRTGAEHEDFWSWRQQMYGAAGRLDPQTTYDIARRLYAEMRAAGWTSVGEFHYVHHGADGSALSPATAMADAGIQAAVDVGLRINLLAVLYHTGGIGEPARPDQRRFISGSVGAFTSLVEALLARWGNHRLVTVGLAPHSVRAVPVDWLEALAQWNAQHHLPVHMHLCEQTAEVEASHRLLGAGPMEVVRRAGLLGPGFVAVHATHLEADDPARLADAGAMVCACPTTEANLGDGFLPASALIEAGVELCVGSDSHIVVNPFEELRLIENNERLQRRRRNVLAKFVDPAADEPDKRRVAPFLLDVGARGGAKSLGLDAGEIKAGGAADLVAVSLRDPALEGVPVDFLAEALIFSADTRCVLDTWVAGVRN